MSNESTDRVERKITLHAPRAKVWKAITTASEFGAWFRVALEGDFAVGRPISGKITYPGAEHLTMTATVEAIEPERRFAFRWHPYAIDPKHDYSAEPTTLVEFLLDEAPGGTVVTVIESGFDKIPAGRRAEAFRMNGQGWSIQVENLRKHVET